MEYTVLQYLQITGVLLLFGVIAIGVVLLAVLPKWKYEEESKNVIMFNESGLETQTQEQMRSQWHDEEEDGPIKDLTSGRFHY